MTRPTPEKNASLYKPASSYSPIGAIPDDEGAHARRRQDGARDDRAAETSAAEAHGKQGLELAPDERAAGGDADR